MARDPAGHPLIVYGTVFPDGTAKSWQPHYDAIHVQQKDWVDYQALHPEYGFVLAGDFNQNRNGPHYYGTRDGRELLAQALRDAQLTCVTDGSLAQSAQAKFHQMIDHICVSTAWLPFVHQASLWEPVGSDGVKASDHHGVSIDLAL